MFSVCGELLYNINFPYRDVSYHTGVQSAEACYEICSNDYAFSWHSPEYVNNKPLGCWCKNSNFEETRQTRTHVVSGYSVEYSLFVFDITILL